MKTESTFPIYTQSYTRNILVCHKFCMNESDYLLPPQNGGDYIIYQVLQINNWSLRQNPQTQNQFDNSI